MNESNSRFVDDVFAVISDATRRRLLYYLREHGSATKTELADVLTGWLAAGRADGAATPEDRHDVELGLYHKHLPVLEGADLVAWNAEEGVVELRDYPAWVDRCLDAAFEIEMTGDTAETADWTSLDDSG